MPRREPSLDRLADGLAELGVHLVGVEGGPRVPVEGRERLGPRAHPAERRRRLAREFVEKAAPDVPHALSQSGILRQLALPFRRKPSESWPGGWWILPEVDLQLGANGFRPDVSGWRRERAPVPPAGGPVTLRPDWICEVLSESNRAHDTVNKLRWYHEAGVPHYWLLDPAAGALNVFRHEPSGYLHLLTAYRPQRVRAEPFDAIELAVGELLGDDPE